MNLISVSKLSQKHQKYLFLAKRTADLSVGYNGNKVGCVLLCKKNQINKGITIARTRVIGSTCAERMALDQWYLGDRNLPIVCYLVGTFQRNTWKDNFICTPCGVCLEMFLEFIVEKNISNIKFMCADWVLNKVLEVNLNDLFPQFYKGGWPYTNLVGKR